MRSIIKDIHFEILGITRYASKDEIKKAYRKQMKLWHPDKFPNQPEKILTVSEKTKLINEAYSVLENYVAPTENNRQNENYNKSYTTNQDRWKSNNRLNIERTNVKSSNVCSVGYDNISQTLQVEFLNGSIYQYYGVSYEVYLELLQSTSIGRFINRFIVGKYKYESV